MTAPSPRIASFFGWSDSGKTTLIAALVRECGRRGLRCGAAKSSRHRGDFGDEGKDTGRLRDAGASPVVYVGQGDARTTVIYMPTPEKPDRAWLEGLFADVDILFAEGLEVEGALCVLVERGDRVGKRELAEIDLLVSDDAGRRGVFGQALGRASGEAVGKAGGAFAHEAVGAILDALEDLWKGK